MSHWQSEQRGAARECWRWMTAVVKVSMMCTSVCMLYVCVVECGVVCVVCGVCVQSSRLRRG